MVMCLSSRRTSPQNRTWSDNGRTQTTNIWTFKMLKQSKNQKVEDFNLVATYPGVVVLGELRTSETVE